MLALPKRVYVCIILINNECTMPRYLELVLQRITSWTSEIWILSVNTYKTSIFYSCNYYVVLVGLYKFNKSDSVFINCRHVYNVNVKNCLWFILHD